jgi:uncharacterized Fe-S cluster-containing protein
MPGLWHNKMESYFPKEMTEIKFLCCINSKDTCRRADVLLNNNRTCEIQHSFISSEEIAKRCNDWNLFGKEIIWLVDGNTGIEYEELSSGNYLIIFKEDWKYKSFITTYNFILLEIGGKVFKIELKKIKCKMIELKMFITIETVVNILKSKPENIWDSWCDDNVIKCNLSIHQQGAGNGKTYGIWKSIAENLDKSTFILLTKQHSAKNVMYEELNDQTERQEYHIENLTEILEDHDKTHFVIKYIHKISKRECKVIIGTIDSFIYNLSGSSKSDNFFEGILQNIKLNGLTKVHNGSMNFAGQYVTLNKQTELWIDEAQDLPNSYLDAMAKLMLNTNCDIHMVGDKLQTLQYEENCLTTIIRDEGLVNNINYIYHTPVNVNRRIKVAGMRQEINRVIDFNKYGLPEIYENDELGEPTIKCFKAETIYKETDDKIIDKYVKNIIDRVDYEVKLNHYTPENFMFIFPIMKDNEVASELHTKLTEYWIQKFNDTEYNKNINNTFWKNYRHDQYTQYVYLHKHTEGTCINTTDSVNASRIMSIRTSKGDGREVVFILQTTEGRLKMCSNKKYGIVYDSHIHVALTRAKYTNYIALEENNDKIHKLFSNCGYVGYFPKIKNTIRLNRIIDNIDKQKIMELMELHITQPDFTLNKQNEKLEENIDWGYHCIKRSVYYFKFILGIVNKRYDNIDFEQSELAVILSKLSRLQIEVMVPSEFYYFLNKNGYNYNDLTVFPLCNLSNNFNYKGYFIKIKDTMKKIQKCIIGNHLDLLNIYETVILIYMITLYKNKKYCDISPVEIYNITDFFKTNSKECCLLEGTKNVDGIINDLLVHVEVKSKWNIQKHMQLNSTSRDFIISNNNFDLIGYDSKNITHIILSSDLNQLNFWDTMITALLERFLIYNPNHDGDCDKFHNKKINTYLVVLKTNNYEKIDWEWDKDMDFEIRKEIKKAMMIHFSENHEAIYNYFCYIKKDNKMFGKGTVFKYILSIMKDHHYPEYIIRAFDELHEKLVRGCKEELKQICDNVNNFNDMLNIKLEIACDNYLGISETSDYDF